MLDIHEGGQAMRLVGPDGTVHFSEQDDGTGERPEVDCGDLRDLLLVTSRLPCTPTKKRSSPAARLRQPSLRRRWS